MEIDENSLRTAFDEAMENHEFAFERFFIARLLRMKFHYEPGLCRVSLDVQPWMYNPRGTMHGGIIALGMDISMGHLLNNDSSPAATLENKIQYLRPVQTGTIMFEGSYIKRGREVQFLQSKLTDSNGSLCAFATATWRNM